MVGKVEALCPSSHFPGELSEQGGDGVGEASDFSYTDSAK